MFDLEHTLIASNVVDSYAWLASRHMEPERRVGFVADMLAAAPRWLNLDRRDRGDFLRYFYRRYEGASVAEVEQDAWDLFHEFLLPRTFPAGIARVRHHRRLGHRTLLITGALDVVVAPAAPALRRRGVRADDRARRRLHRSSRRALPDRRGPGASCSTATRATTASRSSESVAYADSSSDLAMLEAVGYPVAVNPDARLAAIARRRGWLVEQWTPGLGGIAPGCCPSGAIETSGR